MIIIDCEVYKDYFLLAALHVTSGKTAAYEMYDGCDFDVTAAKRLMSGHTTVGFNSKNYDLPIIAAALAGHSCEQIKALSDSIIEGNLPHWQLPITAPKSWDHIDLIELAIGSASLKIYGGRLNAPKMQDLPIEPGASISPEQRKVLREYCINDLETTVLLYKHLKPQIELRERMSEEYGADLRSKSDAQIAEVVIRSEIERVSECEVSKPSIKKSMRFRYQPHRMISFRSEALQKVYHKVLETDFQLAANGSVEMPDWLKAERIRIGQAEYQMGIGGLHSCEKRQFIEAGKGHFLADWDVASYYPNIILAQRLAPKHLGDDFLTVFESIVDRRIAAKREMQRIEKEIARLPDGSEKRIAELKEEHTYHKTQSDAFKLSVNGSFGKLGSKYSFLYSPQLLIQTTLTGQLALLMLIERMEDTGIRVVSANTDGIVLYGEKAFEAAMAGVAWDWMLDTSFELERTDYRCLASRDVNNYLAVKLDGSVKGKGIFAPPSLAKNPDCPIVYEAVANRIARGTPVERTIRDCRNVEKFVTVRRVTGGGVWGDEYLGKAVRYYYATSVAPDQAITYQKNGNKVPKSLGTRPLMVLPDALPDDIDYQVYENEARKLLAEVGYM